MTKMVRSDLPQELMIDIFSRLPAKAVGRCRCLAKIWYTLLSTPQFIKSHLSRKPHQENILVIHRNLSVHSVSDGTVSKRLEMLNNCMKFAGSHDGLVLLEDYEDVKILVNPVTQQQMKISDSPLALNKDESFSMCGFGYDRITDDYKIVVLSYWDTEHELIPGSGDTFVDVYSVKGGFWRRAHNSPYDHAVPNLSCGVFVNGAIHWLASSRERGNRSVIAGFDLAGEVFDEIPAPSGVEVESFVFYTLAVVNGWLCMVHALNSREIDVWIMKEYGVGESWTKLRMDAYVKFDMRLLRFVGDEEVMFLREGGSLNVYNVKEKRSRVVVVDGVPSLRFRDGVTFIQTLVFP